MLRLVLKYLRGGRERDVEQRGEGRLLVPCHLAMNLPKQSLQVLEALGWEREPFIRADFKNNFSSYSLHVHWGRFCCSKNKKPMSDTLPN